MRTITFYSYKGGVGRSLLVANTARYLSALGKSVFAIDLDLEAPGLHYKFELNSDNEPGPPLPGVVDLVAMFEKSRSLPVDLSAYVTAQATPPNGAPLNLMRAGTAPLSSYWRLLSEINWHDLFYGDSPRGVPFFLELQQRIQNEYRPDFMLIDARTGITDMGGVATTLLPDCVICLGLSSHEHLEGLRAAMRGIKNGAQRYGRNVTLYPVISRLKSRDVSAEAAELVRVKEFLSASEAGAQAPQFDEIGVLHAEPMLDTEEQLLVAGRGSPHELPLLRDYLRLFSKMIPAEEIRPNVGRLIQQAVARLLDDPDGAQGDLEALTAYCADDDAYNALLKLYQVRKTPIEKSLAIAELMWKLRPSHSTEPPESVQIVIRQAFSESRGLETQKRYAQFAEEVWRASGMSDIKVGLSIAVALLPDHRLRAIRLLGDYIERTDSPNPLAVIRTIDLLRADQQPNAGLAVIDRFKATIDDAIFQSAWARFIVATGQPHLARDTIADKHFRADAVRINDPLTLHRLLRLAGAEVPSSLLSDAIESATSNQDYGQLTLLATVLSDEGRTEELEVLRTRMPPRYWQEVVDRNKARRMRRFAQ